MSDKKLELARQVADVMVAEMMTEAHEVGLMLGDYDIHSFYDKFDDFTFEVQRCVESTLRMHQRGE